VSTPRFSRLAPVGGPDLRPVESDPLVAVETNSPELQVLRRYFRKTAKR
jgi:hypothetical protein